ncbi:4Fe-4S ferredoxin, partial [Candidatus Bathyarchaeota archaeon]|nr:4Fe-4S ferredoxin [Candidatus Bathyarchaeota archaeon]
MTENLKDDEVFQQLAENLDRLPGGFSPSKTGAHIRLLKKLFTSSEAELSTHLTLNQEDVKTIANRVGLKSSEAEKML